MSGIITAPWIDNSPIERRSSFTESRLLMIDSQNIPFKRESGAKDMAIGYQPSVPFLSSQVLLMSIFLRSRHKLNED